MISKCYFITNLDIIVNSFKIYQIITDYQTCDDYYNDGITVSGNYKIDPDLDGPMSEFEVYCDFNSSMRLFINHVDLAGGGSLPNVNSIL